jgi:hypothetical protein
MNYYIYVIGPKEPPIKIGITGNLNQRLRSLQTGHDKELFIHHSEEVLDNKTARIFESILHKNLKYRQTYGEWFDISIQDAIEHIKWCIIRYGDDSNIHYKNKAGLLL